LKPVKKSEPDIIRPTLVQPPIIAIPVANHAVSCGLKILRIVPNEGAVKHRVKHSELGLTSVEDLDYILASQLKNKWNNPRFGDREDTFKLTLAHMAIVVPG
jgi:hypothetical protein